MSDPASCRGCTTRWTGLRVCHCSACHATFSGLSAFDAHRLRGKCKTPKQLGMVLSTQATSTLVWRLPNDLDDGAAD